MPSSDPRTVPDTTQRLRIGALGLACVFLLVMLAAAFLRNAGSDHPAVADNVAANAAEPTEPLAQLGVAPGNVDPAPAAPPPAPTRLPTGF